MKLKLDPTLFFPASTITTAFGWDPITFPEHPRIHTAVDRAGHGLVHAPIAANRTVWLDNDAEGCSVFRLFFEGGELRMLHFIRDELDSGAIAAALVHAPLDLGAPIGPAGNHGLSVSKHGGDGRHVHYSLILEPGIYDDDIAAAAGPAWNKDLVTDFRDHYGDVFVQQCRMRRITWMNNWIIARADPYYGGKLRYYINTTRLLGM